MNPQAAELLTHFFITLICTLPCAKDKKRLQHLSLGGSLCPRQNILWERWVDAFWEERELQTLSGASNHVTQLCQLWADKAIQTQVISLENLLESSGTINPAPAAPSCSSALLHRSSLIRGGAMLDQPRLCSLHAVTEVFLPYTAFSNNIYPTWVSWVPPTTPSFSKGPLSQGLQTLAYKMRRGRSSIFRNEHHKSGQLLICVKAKTCFNPKKCISLSCTAEI